MYRLQWWSRDVHWVYQNRQETKQTPLIQPSLSWDNIRAMVNTWHMLYKHPNLKIGILFVGMDCWPALKIGNLPKFWRNPARAKSQHQRPFPVKGGTGCQKGSPRMKREGEPWDCTTRIKPSTTASGWRTAKASTLQNFHWSQGHVNMTQAKHAIRTTTGKATCWVKPQVKLGTQYLSWAHLFSTVFTLELLWRIFFVL